MVFVGDISIVNGICLPLYNLGGTTLYILIWPFLHDRRPANDTPFFERPCIPSSVGQPPQKKMLEKSPSPARM